MKIDYLYEEKILNYFIGSGYDEQTKQVLKPSEHQKQLIIMKLEQMFRMWINKYKINPERIIVESKIYKFLKDDNFNDIKIIDGGFNPVDFIRFETTLNE